jgi:hypothetical protein
MHMAEKEQAGPQLYALLIGIDCYLPLKPSDTPNPMNLRGCVGDINRAEEFLSTRLSLAANHILKLTATTDVCATQPAEPPDKWPTRENIVNAFRWLDEVAAPGDQIYVHYSGHGGRVRTPPRFQHLKWGGDMDEVLVPTDYSLTEDNFLRDFELAHILRGYVDRQLNVTVVLDSCHSGGATRGEPAFTGLEQNGIAVRTIEEVRDTLPPPRIPVASDAELAATWQALAAKPTRDFHVGNAWQLEPEGYLLLAACRASEYAYEQAFDGTQHSGALTYWLLDSLERLGADVSAKTLYDRVLAKVHSYFRQQTPQLQGVTDRAFFGPGRANTPAWVNVLQVAEAADEVELNVGQAQGVSRDARFAIYPRGETDFTRVERRRALASIKTLGATSSRATIIERFSAEAVEQGDQAVLLESGQPNVRRTLRVVAPAAGHAPTELATALQDVEHNITRRGGSFLQSAADGERADFLVSINERGEFVVGDASGTPFPHLRPTLNVADVSAPFYLVERLVHLAKYLNVHELDNCDPFSPLRRTLSAELLGVQADYVMGDKPAPQPLAQGARLKTGEWTFLKISNSSSQVLNVTVLDLRPNWSIGQLYPAGAAFYEPLDPGRSVELPLRASLPQGYDEGRDVLKVMGTVGPSNFRWLELSALDEPDKGRTGWRGSSATPLDEFLAAFMNDGSGFRDLIVEANASHEWTTVQVEIDVRSGGGKN